MVGAGAYGTSTKNVAAIQKLPTLPQLCPVFALSSMHSRRPNPLQRCSSIDEPSPASTKICGIFEPTFVAKLTTLTAASSCCHIF